MLTPKLLVVRRPATDRPTSGTDQLGGAGSCEQHVELYSALRQQMILSHEGPVLELDAHDADWEVQELRAAVEAMR